MITYHTIRPLLCQIVILLSLVIFSCRKQDTAQTDGSAYLPSMSGKYRDYYLPLASLPAEGKVYTYKSLLYPDAVREVWRHTRQGDNGILSVNYDPSGEPVLWQYDRIVENGILADSLIILYRDSMDNAITTKVTIHSPNRFPFAASDTSQFWLTHFEWWQPTDSLHIVLKRQRYFVADTTWNWMGTSMPALRFRTEDSFETERDGWTTSAWTGEEIYVKDLGMVYYRRNISEEISLEFELESITP